MNKDKRKMNEGFNSGTPTNPTMEIQASIHIFESYIWIFLLDWTTLHIHFIHNLLGHVGTYLSSSSSFCMVYWSAPMGPHVQRRYADIIIYDLIFVFGPYLMGFRWLRNLIHKQYTNIIHYQLNLISKYCLHPPSSSSVYLVYGTTPSSTVVEPHSSSIRGA